MLAFSIVQAPMHSTLQDSALASSQVFLKSFQARQASSTFALDAIDLGASKAPDFIASSMFNLRAFPALSTHSPKQ